MDEKELGYIAVGEESIDSGGSDTAPDSGVVEKTRVQRLFNFTQLFFLAMTFMSGWEAISGNLYPIFLNGGPQVATWGGLLVITSALAQSASLAETAAMLPIAGAQYHWTYLLAPARFRNLITWYQGWLTVFGWISMIAGVMGVNANYIEAIVYLYNPDMVFQNWHTTLIMFATLTPAIFINLFAFRFFPIIQTMLGSLHIILYIMYAVVLLVLTKKNTTEWVWFSRVDSSQTSGWNNSFVGWNLGLLPSIWCFVGFDGAVHLSEEVKKARHAVPRVIFWSIALNAFFMFTFLLILLYCAPNIDAALNSYQPLFYIFQNATGSLAATTAMATGLLFIGVAVMITGIASASRLTWAWARDGALPGIFAIVDARTRIPVRSVLLVISVTMAIALINIGNAAAFEALISLSSFAIYCSYFVVISCMIHSRLFGRLRSGALQLGGWNLGRWGLAVNLYAWVTLVWLAAFIPFPSEVPVTAANMNWAAPIVGLILFVASAAWMVPGWRWRGPSDAIIRAAIKET